MKRFFPIIIILMMMLSACSSPNANSPTEKVISDNGAVDEDTGIEVETENEFPQYEVVRVVDGDTIVINYEGTEEKVRLIGVDTPESVHPDKEKNSAFGEQVSSYSKSRLSDKLVGIEFDVQERDQYGRLLAYVYIENQMFNKTLLEVGYASVATYPPNVKYVDEFTAIQKEAREEKKGMWDPIYTESSGSTANNSTKSVTNGEYRGHNKNMKFHVSGCRYGEMISDENLTLFKSRDAALNAGYAACKVCNP